MPVPDGLLKPRTFRESSDRQVNFIEAFGAFGHTEQMPDMRLQKYRKDMEFPSARPGPNFGAIDLAKSISL